MKALRSPGVGLVIVLVGATLAVLSWRPEAGLGMALAITFAAFVVHREINFGQAIAALFFLLVLVPELAAAPPVIPLGGASIYVPHILIVLLLPFVDWSILQPWAKRAVGAFALISIWMALWGILLGAPINGVLQDVRGPLTYVGGVIAALVLVKGKGVSGLLRLVPPILGLSLLLIGFQLATGAQILGGRVRGATVFNGRGASARAIDATRSIISSEDLAVVALLVVGWWLTQSRISRPRQQTLVLVAALGAMVIVLSLSRQLLVGLAVGTVSWVLSRRGAAQLVRIGIAAIPFLLVGAVGLGVLTAFGQGFGSDGLVGRQLGGFTERVLGGLTSEGISQDAGTAWRQRENMFALQLIGEQPLGTGFGRPYRPEFAIEAFGDPTFFRRWVHNVYLWYGTKGGYLGFVAVGLVTFVPLVAAIRRARGAAEGSDPVAEVAVPVLFALGVMSLVDPVIINANSGVITAAVMVLLGLRDRPVLPGSTAAKSPVRREARVSAR